MRTCGGRYVNTELLGDVIGGNEGSFGVVEYGHRQENPMVISATEI